MTSLEVHKTVNAPASTVWETITNLESSPDIIGGIESVEILTDGPFSVGTRWRETRTMFGKSSTEEMEVTGVDAGRSYVVEADGHGVHYRSVMSVVPVDEETCTLSMTFAGEPTSTASKFFAATIGKMFEGGTEKALQQDLEDIAVAAQSR
ncbi:MAG: SRPBCC family protein [Acidimicrobiia bacterium]